MTAEADAPRRVRLDHNATTPLRPEARAALLEALDEGGNASSVHEAGRRARARVDEARERVAAALGVHEDEVVFTSGGTESNNLAIHGALADGVQGGLVTSAIEHASVLGPARRQAERGRALSLVGVDAAGRTDPEEVLALVAELAMRGGCALVSLAAANNEIGTLGPLEAVGAGLSALEPGRPRLHTDAVQALGRVPLDLAAMGADLASFSAHKVGGPVGVGVLFRRRGVSLASLFDGGEQEDGLRPGTENVAGIWAAARAIELAAAEQASYAARTRELATALWEGLRAALPDARLVGPPIDSAERLPNTIGVSLAGIDGRVLVTRLDLAGLETSAGSACASGSLEPSHVLVALGLDAERARAGLRLSLGRETTHADIRLAVDILRKTLAGADHCVT